MIPVVWEMRGAKHSRCSHRCSAKQGVQRPSPWTDSTVPGPAYTVCSGLEQPASTHLPMYGGPEV